MFDGVPDQFHQFIASSAAAAARASTIPLPLSFPSLHHLSSSNGFTSFDPFSTSNSHHQLQQQPPPPHFLLPLHQPQKNDDHEEKEENTSSLVGMNMEIETERSMAEEIDNHQQQQPWSNDEVLALLRIRSSMENWFPEFTSWEHVSRKLAELGFKRSADKCKEKFEEESRYFNTINYSKNYRIFNELEELCQGDENPPPPPPPPHHHNQQQILADDKNKNVDSREEEDNTMGQNLEDDSRNIVVDDYQTTAGNSNNNGSDQANSERVVENKAKVNKMDKKRTREMKFEMFKGFCEDIVNKLMSQQEEMHKKLLQDMVKRDKEKVEREEAWKKREMDRINQELELRAKEQVIAGDRQATIIKFLNKFASTSSASALSTASSKKQCLGRRNGEDLLKVQNDSNPTSSSSSLVPAQNPNPVDQIYIHGQQTSASFPTQNTPTKPTSMAENQTLQNPNPKSPTPSALAMDSPNPNSVNARKTPTVPLTSSMAVNKATQDPTSNDKEDLGKRWPRDEVLALINLRCSFYNNGDHEKEGAIKTPLWERISQGMLELGYNRSAKRCKEKWENINKYFRKTKDVNKKRSLDSRTCPYFHKLSTLYRQGTLMVPYGEVPENHPSLLENHPGLSETGTQGETTATNMQVQAPAFEFEL